MGRVDSALSLWLWQAGAHESKRAPSEIRHGAVSLAGLGSAPPALKPSGEVSSWGRPGPFWASGGGAAAVSGIPSPNWANDDAASFGEGIARSTTCPCRAPLQLECRETLIVIRCSHCAKIAEHYQIYPEPFCEA
jgi:hypothetical protein